MTDSSTKTSISYSAEQEADRIRHIDVSWRIIVKLVVGVIAILVLMPTAKALTPLLPTVVVSIFLAIVIDTIVRALQRRGMSRGAAIALVFTSGTLGFVLVAALIARTVVTQTSRLIAVAPTVAKQFEQSSVWQQISTNTNVSNEIIKHVQTAATSVPQTITTVVSGTVNSVFGLVTVMFATIFLLTGGDRVISLMMKIFPRLAEGSGRVVVIGAYNNIGRYAIGATIQALCAGISLAIVLLLVGTPYAIALGMLMLVMDYIPLVGATLGAIPAIAFAFFGAGTWQGVVVLIFIVIYQQFENGVIQPRIQGRVVNLPGVAIFFSVIVGAQLFGVLGALMAVPAASVLSIMIREYLIYIGRLDTDVEPLLETAETADDATPL